MKRLNRCYRCHGDADKDEGDTLYQPLHGQYVFIVRTNFAKTLNNGPCWKQMRNAPQERQSRANINEYFRHPYLRYLFFELPATMKAFQFEKGAAPPCWLSETTCWSLQQPKVVSWKASPKRTRHPAIQGELAIIDALVQ